MVRKDRLDGAAPVGVGRQTGHDRRDLRSPRCVAEGIETAHVGETEPRIERRAQVIAPGNGDDFAVRASRRRLRRVGRERRGHERFHEHAPVVSALAEEVDDAKKFRVLRVAGRRIDVVAELLAVRSAGARAQGSPELLFQVIELIKHFSDRAQRLV